MDLPGCGEEAAAWPGTAGTAFRPFPAPNPELGEGKGEGDKEREALRVLSDEVIPKKDKGSGACTNLSGDVSPGKAD